MRKNVLKKVVAVMVVGVIFFSGSSALASNQNLSPGMDESPESVSPHFIAIIKYWNNLTLNAGGRLTCEGETQVQYGYKAGINMELQQYNNGWNTIKTWSGSDLDVIYLSRDRYVESGHSYRLKLTHRALDDNDTVIETFVSHSKIVTY